MRENFLPGETDTPSQLFSLVALTHFFATEIESPGRLLLGEYMPIFVLLP